MVEDTTPTRRRVLQALGATSATGLAGCGGGGQGQQQTQMEQEGGGATTQEQGELGERVPKVNMMFFSNMGVTPIIEDQMEIAANNISNRLGVRAEPVPTELVTGVTETLDDKRTSALPHMPFFIKPRRIDPTDELNNIVMSEIGVGGGISNYASENSCEYDRLYYKQLAETDQEKRKEIVTEMFKISTKDVAVIPFLNSLNFSVWNKEKIETKSLGRLAVSQQNPSFFINSSPKDGDTMVVEVTTEVLGSIQPSRHTGGMPPWSQLVHSGLQRYNENMERENLLAKSVEFEKDGQQIIVELIDGAVFQNGDPITSEDVKFTFDYIAENPAGAPEFPRWPHKSIEIIDEKTAQFNQEWPNNLLPTNNFPMAGIWHKDSMIEAGAVDNPGSYHFSDASEIVGSGPFKPVHSEPNSSMRLEPFKDHPVFDVDHNLQLKSFNNKQTAIQSFKNGELHTLFRLQFQIFEQLRGNDEFGSHVAKGFTQTSIWPQFPFAPTKFKAFRKAVSQSLDRKKMNQLTVGGEGVEQLHGATIPTTHPWHDDDKVPDVSPSPTGDEEVARQTLRDAGWGWDDNGNLHYPADADLSPLWPQGETPSAEKYPCIEKSGKQKY